MGLPTNRDPNSRKLARDWLLCPKALILGRVDTVARFCSADQQAGKLFHPDRLGLLNNREPNCRNLVGDCLPCPKALILGRVDMLSPDCRTIGDQTATTWPGDCLSPDCQVESAPTTLGRSGS